jgi:hypothetical protein
MTPAVILAAMTILGPCPPRRCLPVAVAIAQAARSREEAALLVAQGWHESRWAAYVLEGRCQDGPPGARCDEGRARGPWQVWHYCRATTTAGEARCVLATARLAVARCGSWDGAFAALAGKGGCAWSGAPRRVETMRAVLTGWAE